LDERVGGDAVLALERLIHEEDEPDEGPEHGRLGRQNDGALMGSNCRWASSSMYL
jgi:hypothetical protein